MQTLESQTDVQIYSEKGRARGVVREWEGGEKGSGAVRLLLLPLLLVLPLQLLMMCGRQNQSGAHKDTRIVATNHVDPPPLSLPPPLHSRLSSTLFYSICLPARSSFFVQLRKLLSVCPLPACAASSPSSPSSPLLSLFTTLQLFFGSYTYTHTLAHCIRLCLFVFYCTFSSSFSFCHHSPVSHCYLKTMREGAEKSLRRIKVATLLLCFSCSHPPPSHS